MKKYIELLFYIMISGGVYIALIAILCAVVQSMVTPYAGVEVGMMFWGGVISASLFGGANIIYFVTNFIMKTDLKYSTNFSPAYHSSTDYDMPALGNIDADFG